MNVFVNYVATDSAFCRFEDEMSFFRKHSKKTLTWKYVDSEALSSLGLTSGVRKASD